MDGQQAHGIIQHRGRCLHATGLEGAHEGVGRGKTPAPQLQRHPQQRPQIGQHRIALHGGRGLRKPG